MSLLAVELTIGQARKVELTDEQTDELREAFELFDADASGSIDAKELKIALKALGIDLSKADVKKLLDEIDKDKSGSIEFSEFYELMAPRIATKDTREDVLDVFTLFDEKDKG